MARLPSPFPAGPQVVALGLGRFALALIAGGLSLATALGSQVKTSFVQLGRDGSLSYVADAKQNRIPDFSLAGYRGGAELPHVPAKVRVDVAAGDAGARIQAAIDYVAGLAPDAQGWRGAVVLARGTYAISGQLRIAASGVVLRGSGDGADGTVLLATGTDRRALLRVEGTADRTTSGERMAVVDAYVPVGATRVTVAAAGSFRVGERVLIERPSTKEWIAAIGMDDSPGREPFAWQAGKMNLAWERTITAIDGTQIAFDAPLTTALQHEFGGGSVVRVDAPGRLHEVGIENLRCVAETDPANPKDENHAWMAIAFDHVENGWVAGVTALHFASSTVQLGAGTRAITVQDCASLAPVSEVGGYRRHSFHTRGQLTLFQRCRAERGIHDFTVGYLTCGPNVFLDCRADEALGWSGSIGSWASGVLFDNVRIDGAGLRLDNLETWNQGVGWALANSVAWQCSASVMTIRRPPTAQNWAVGVWAEFLGDGWWDQVNEFVRPESLYRAQRAARTGRKPAEPGVAVVVRTSGDEQAPKLEAVVPDLATRLAPKPATVGQPLRLERGWLVAEGALVTGKPTGELQWWRGMVLPTRAAEFNASVTRFAPGLSGTGLTDDLDELTDAMVRRGEVVLRHHYGLWYDRRRMDHERIRRATPDVWPPFFEQPFARSGQGEAWDRMSRYDLTRYNPWYFGRLHAFAGLAREKGLVLVNEMYFQHNILEAGAHWADSPWRPANCIQPTGFPEPPPYTDTDGEEGGSPDMGKRIFMAEAFYDPTHPVRGPLHRAFIRQCLANLADQPNVVHTLTAENSGPLAFMQFWLDVVAEWERETGRHPLIALSAPKDVQDAILSDARRAAVVDVIDLTYWWRTDKGELYAPAGGTKLAPRQHERLWKGGKPGAASLAGMVREYRAKFPDKAVITALEQGDGWAFVAAGGSLAKLPATTDAGLKAALARMRPADQTGGSRRAWVLADDAGGYFVCALDAGAANLEVAKRGTYEIRTVDPKTGQVDAAPSTLELTGTLALARTASSPGLWWVLPEARP